MKATRILVTLRAVLCVLCASAVNISAAEPRPALDFRDAALLCIQEGGRKKPLHTFAVESVEQIVGRPLFAGTPYWLDEATGRNYEAMDLLLAIWLEPDHLADKPFILISYGPLREDLGFPKDQKRFTYNQLMQSAQLRERRRQVEMTPAKERKSDVADLLREVEIVDGRLGLVQMIREGGAALGLVPHPSDENGAWLPLDALREKPPYTDEQIKHVLDCFDEFKRAYLAGDAAAFPPASQNLHATLAALSPEIYPAANVLAREVSYNQARPFGRAWGFYLCAALLAFLALCFPARWLYALTLLVFSGGLCFHIYGFVLRTLIAGRAPVANMYESVIWAGFGAVVFGLIFELIYRRRYFLLSGALAGAGCLLLMDLMPVVLGNASAPGFEAQIRPLNAVLRDNFWLSVHVLTIGSSYAAFMLAWVLAHITLGRHIIWPAARPAHRELHQFVYRALQVGVLLLAAGTILGAVWAYYAWGRFWGWDSKETWSLITLLCYVALLHGRFAGWWRDFGFSVGAVVCFLAVVMAWYGVNFVLGSGKHAYASGTGGLLWVSLFVILDLAFTAAAIVRAHSSQARE
jgi:ABC-type transport system involved in cytochrome c biogenesis permease subunit